MATTVYETVELVLQDGTEVEVKPLSIRDQRKATRVLSDFSKAVADKEFEGLDDVDFNDKFIDALIEVAKLALAKKNPELLKKPDELLDLLDSPTLTKIVQVAANWSFDAEDPKATASPLAGRS